MRPYYAWLVSIGEPSKELTKKPPAQTSYAHQKFPLALDSAATSPDKQQSRLLDLSKPKFSKISFSLQRYYFVAQPPLFALASLLRDYRRSSSRRASQDNKIRVFVNSSEGAGRPLARPAKRGSRGRLRDIEHAAAFRRGSSTGAIRFLLNSQLFQVSNSNVIACSRQLLFDVCVVENGVAIGL